MSLPAPATPRVGTAAASNRRQRSGHCDAGSLSRSPRASSISGPSSRIRISRQWPKRSVFAAFGSKDPAKVEDGIGAAFAHDGPVLIDAVVSRTELAMPPSINIEMAKGFSLYMVKAIMSGRTDEIIDLAKTNLWR